MAELKQRNSVVSVTGTIKYYLPSPSSGTSTATNIGTRDSCLSEYGKRESANPLSIYHIYKQVPYLYGQRFQSGVLEREFIGYPIGNHALNIPDPRVILGSVTNAELIEDAWTILSKTNPSQAHVSVPTALGELKDIPSLVKGWGDGLLKAAAKGNLSWRWAIKPMISDVRKLADFTNAANKRLRELKKLRDGKTLRKRCSLGTRTEESGPTRELIHSNGASLYGQRREFAHQTKWGSCEWKLSPDSNLPQYSDADLKRFNKRVMLGITSHGALETAWELCPWSWFVDWFSNVGDIISATNNTVGCTWGRICVMRHSNAWRTYDFDPAGSATWPTFSGWYNLRMERKERWPTYPAIPFPLPSLPLIDGGKFSILLSLAALRR